MHTLIPSHGPRPGIFCPVQQRCWHKALTAKGMTAKFLTNWGLLFVLLLCGFFLHAKPAGALEITAHVDRTQITQNDTVLLTVSVKDGDGDVDISPITDFRVISKGSSSSVSIINTRMTRTTLYNYTLAPLKKGELKIPALAVSSKGETYHTEVITVVVSETRPMDADKASELFMTLSVSNANPFVGQQLTCIVKVYHAVRMANARFQPPDFAGFSERKIDQDRSYTTTIGSRPFTVIELNYVLIPQKPGVFTMGPAMLSCDVARSDFSGRNRRDPFFDDPFFGGGLRLVPRTVSSDSVDITVRELPEPARDQSQDQVFSGLVGRFEIKGILDKSEVSEGDSVTLSVTISGAGNLMEAPEPEIVVPDTFKVYKDAPEDRIQLNETGYSGEKTFRWALVPMTRGEFVLAPVTLVYFDVSLEAYRVIQSTPLPLMVLPSKEEGAAGREEPGASGVLPKFEKKHVDFVGKDILPLKEEIDALPPLGVLPLRWFLLFMMAPWIIYGATRIFMKIFQRQADDKIQLTKAAFAALKKAEKSKASSEACLGALYAALVSAVHAVGGNGGGSLTFTEVKSILTDKGLHPDLAHGAAVLLEKIESARYGGKGLLAEEKNALVEETKTMIKRMLKWK